MDRLAGLSEDEKFACLIAERCLGAVAEAWDVDGRQGAVDAMLALPNGLTAAFEVTKLAADGALQTQGILAAENHSWPLPGEWHWTISVGSPSDIPRLRMVYENIILICEKLKVARPELIGWSPNAHADIKWLVQESSSRMTGHPTVLGKDLKSGPSAMVVPIGGGGFVDHRLEGMHAALLEAFDRVHISKRFDKLAIAKADRHHLFVALHDTGLPFSIWYELALGETLPPEEPPVPSHISDFWLAPPWGRRVLHWNRSTGWTQYFPYDN